MFQRTTFFLVFLFCAFQSFSLFSEPCCCQDCCQACCQDIDRDGFVRDGCYATCRQQAELSDWSSADVVVDHDKLCASCKGMADERRHKDQRERFDNFVSNKSVCSGDAMDLDEALEYITVVDPQERAEILDKIHDFSRTVPSSYIFMDLDGIDKIVINKPVRDYVLPIFGGVAAASFFGFGVDALLDLASGGRVKLFHALSPWSLSSKIATAAGSFLAALGVAKGFHHVDRLLNMDERSKWLERTHDNLNALIERAELIGGAGV